MKKRFRVGIAGCGAIGSSIAQSVSAGALPGLTLSCLYDIDFQRARQLSRRLKPAVAVAVSPGKLVSHCDILVEAASASGSYDICRAGLSRGRDVLVMSVAGIADRIDTLKKLADKGRGRLFIPSGAIAGIDGLKGACRGTVKSVTLTTVKPPRAFAGVSYLVKKGIDLSGITARKVLFSGTAAEAVKFFPQNINVAAVLSLAGTGIRRTKVTIVADPACRNNSHTIEVVASSGSITATTENTAHPDNPKTSYLAVLAALATLAQIRETVRIGT